MSLSRSKVVKYKSLSDRLIYKDQLIVSRLSIKPPHPRQGFSMNFQPQ